MIAFSSAPGLETDQRQPVSGEEVIRNRYLISDDKQNALDGERAAISFELESFTPTTLTPRTHVDDSLVEQLIVDQIVDGQSRSTIIHGHRDSRVELLARKVMEDFQERGGIAVSVDALEFAHGKTLYPRIAGHPYQMLTHEEFDQFLSAIQRLREAEILHNPGQDVLVVISGLSSCSTFDLNSPHYPNLAPGIRERLTRLNEIDASVVLTNLFSHTQPEGTDYLVDWIDALRVPGFDRDDGAKMVRVDRETTARIFPFHTNRPI